MRTWISQKRVRKITAIFISRRAKSHSMIGVKTGIIVNPHPHPHLLMLSEDLEHPIENRHSTNLFERNQLLSVSDLIR